MALGPRLDLRQSQSLVMTPQLQQAIKLLALSNLEVEAFIGEALEANPLLELGDTVPAAAAEAVEAPDDVRRTSLESSPVDQLVAEGRAGDDRPLDIDDTALDRDRDTGDWSAEFNLGSGSDDDGNFLENRAGGDVSLAEHLDNNDWAGCDSLLATLPSLSPAEVRNSLTEALAWLHRDGDST